MRLLELPFLCLTACRSRQGEKFPLPSVYVFVFITAVQNEVLFLNGKRKHFWITWSINVGIHYDWLIFLKSIFLSDSDFKSCYRLTLNLIRLFLLNQHKYNESSMWNNKDTLTPVWFIWQWHAMFNANPRIYKSIAFHLSCLTNSMIKCKILLLTCYSNH